MKSLKLCIVSCIVLLCFAPMAQAQSLKLKRQIQDWDKDIKHYTDQASEHCGKKFSVELDVDSWDPKEGQETYSFGSYCGNGCVFALEMMCKDDLGKEAVSSQVDKVICHHKQSDGRHLEVTLKDKVLECTFSLHDMQFQNYTVKELEGLL